jgi:hypothetical protein
MQQGNVDCPAVIPKEQVWCRRIGTLAADRAFDADPVGRDSTLAQNTQGAIGGALISVNLSTNT